MSRDALRDLNIFICDKLNFNKKVHWGWVFSDLPNAFNTVDLINFITSVLPDLIKSNLPNRKQSVRINDDFGYYIISKS